jgi:hypothetical protein
MKDENNILNLVSCIIDLLYSMSIRGKIPDLENITLKVNIKN